MSFSERWFRLLLRLYPADFRDEMGEALVETYLHRAAETSPVWVWWVAFWDSLRNGLGERLRPAVAWKRTGNWGRDLELVSRRLRQKPLFLLAVLGTLTVGLGTFAVVYTAVDKILIEPLAYHNPGDLYKVMADVDYLNVHEGNLAGSQIVELPKWGGVVEDAAAFACGNGAIPATDDRDAYHINMMVTSANMFDLLGARPAIGRGFRPDEGSSDAIVLSDRMWRRLGANPDIAGTKLRVGPDTHTVIGVMRPEFGFTCVTAQVPDIYVPFDFTKVDTKSYDFTTLMRARHGTLPQTVRQAVDAFGRSLDELARLRHDVKIYAVGLQADLVKQVRPALLALSFAGTSLMLVLTVNLASLLLARAAEREREFAVSRALGAN